MQTDSVAEAVYQQLRQEIADIKKRVDQIANRTERAEYTDGVPAYAFGNLPTTGKANGSTYITMVWVTDGRKSGEGVGAGTGVLAIWQASSATWKRVGDYTDVLT